MGAEFYEDANDFCEEHPDVVILASSILSTEPVLRSLPLTRLKRSTLVVDVLSVKVRVQPDIGAAGAGQLCLVAGKLSCSPHPGAQRSLCCRLGRKRGTQHVQQKCAWLCGTGSAGKAGAVGYFAMRQHMCLLVANKLTACGLLSGTQVFPKQLLLSLLPPELDILCTHPMFGPDSGKGSWSGLNFMFDPVRVGSDPKRQQRLELFLNFFRQQGCR